MHGRTKAKGRNWNWDWNLCHEGRSGSNEGVLSSSLSFLDSECSQNVPATSLLSCFDLEEVKAALVCAEEACGIRTMMAMQSYE
jgi:hypothetical protein